MSRNNNNQKKGRSKSQKTAALVASLANEIKQLKTHQGGNAKPSKNRGRGARNRAAKKANTIEATFSNSDAVMMQQGSIGQRPANKIAIGDEFVADIPSSVLFALTQFQINPGLVATFPRLSREAQLYEKYRFRKLIFYYKPVVTEFSANGIGKVIFSADFDAADAPPVNKQQMEDTYPHCDSLPCKVMGMSLNPADMDDTYKWHYVRFAALDPNEDIKTYDVGTLNVATLGQATVAPSMGELRVHYEVELKTPVLESDLPDSIGGTITGGGAQTPANPIGTVPVPDPDSIGITMDAASVLTIARTGTYLVSITVGGTVLSAITVVATGGTAVSAISAVANAGATQVVRSLRVIATQPNATFAITATGTTVTSSAVFVGRCPTGSLA